jgi:hypothetical protein
MKTPAVSGLERYSDGTGIPQAIATPIGVEIIATPGNRAGDSRPAGLPGI